MISFILYYQSITAKGISLINTDTNSFSIKIVQSNQPQLQIYLANSSPQLFNLGQSGSRHTIAFKVTGFKIQSQVTYYVDSNQVGSFTLANTLNPFSFIYLGSQQQQPNDNFQIQDLYLIPNSDFKLNFPADPTVVPQNCNYFFYFNLNFTYCLSCQANYQLNYFGQCDPTSQQAQIQQIQFSYSYSGNNFISILDSTQSSSFAYNYQASNNQFDFLILGYYQITQWQQNQLFTSLAYLQADQVNQYYFLNLYLESLTKLTLKLTLDADNLICYQSINFSNSILNQWVFLGFGFKASSLQAYLVFQDNDRISQYLKFTCQHSQNGVQFNSFQICLGCLITNSNLYSQFVGKIKNVKLIEAFNDYTNINQYIYFDQDLMEQSASNINYINIYNLKDLYTYSMPGFSFVCQNGYYFIEGICVAQCSNVIRSSTALGFYNPLFTNYATSSCEICSQNCLVCSSFQTCTSCRAGFVVDQQSQQCVSCTQGTFYDNASQTCVQTCTSITDLMNQQCVTQQDAAVLNSLNFFVSQLLTYNEGFQIINSNGISQQDTFTKCQGNSPYSFFMFYGGESVSSTYQIQKTWSDLPNNYSKDIQFNVVLFNFNSLDDLQVQINGQIITYIQALLISQNQNICVSSNQQQIQAIYQLSYKIISNANTVQLVIKYRQNGFGIRNIQLSVNKCHSSCNSCENGPKPWNCITCQRKNNLTSTQQCICAIDEYYQSNQCYSSPCYNCVKCSIQNCLRCEDETGLCLICSSGYSLLQGQCVANCSQQQLYSSYTINSSTTYCYLANKLAFDHFQTGKIIRNLEYWQLSVDYISQNGFLLGCILNKLLPNLGNVNGVQDYITLQMFVSQFQSKFRGILFDINLVIIDNLTLNQDYIVFTFAGTEVNRVTYQGQPTTYSTCVNHSYSEFIAEVLLPIYKGDGQINLQIQSLFNDAKSNKSFALGEVKAYFIVNEPLCIKYSFGLNYSSSQCQSCNTNSSLGLNNQCICNDGYFFYYKQDQLDAVYIQSHLCVSQCQSNQKQSKNPSNGQILCVICDQTCLTCLGPYKTDCITCSNNYYLDSSSNLCVQQCQSNQYQSLNANTGQIICLPCNQACQTCQGPNNTDCLICINNYYLDYVSNLCVPQCSSNQYQKQNLSTGQVVCMPCDQNCLTCSDKDKCLTCDKSLFLYSSQCLLQCPNNYQINQNTNTCDLCQIFLYPQCQPCDITCKQCKYGQTDSNSCISCYETKQLIDSQCICRNSQDQRNNYFQCSYQNVAVLDIYLSSADPLLTIEFGSQLQFINKYSTPSSQFCSAIFDSNSLILIGPNSTCFISGSQILVNLENNSTLMQNDNLNFNRNVLSFQGQNMFITNFYKTSVSQINKGKSETIFSYSSVQNICSNIVISFKQFVNDAQRGLLSLNWSVVSFSSIPTEQNLKTINQILQNANQSKQTSLTITKQLVPIDSILTLQLFQIFKVNQNKTQTFQIYYTDKSIYVEYKQSQQPPYYRQMGISYSFTFLTLICSNNVSSFQLLPTNIQITPSSQISYLKNSYNNYQGHNLEVDILQYTLPSNQISSFNVTFSLYKNTNITNSVSVGLEVLSSPIFVKINGSNNMIINYKSQLYLQGTSRDFDIQDPNSDQGITLTWQCLNLQNSMDSNCYDYKKQLVLLKQGYNNITINQNTFAAYSTLRFTFSGVKDSRQQQSSSVVCIFAELDLPPLYVDINYKESYNINEDITALLSYNSNYSSDILTYAGTLLYDNQAVGALKFDFYKVRFRIWDFFSNLKEGENSLQIRFSIYNPYFSMPSTSIININLNFPPYNCQFTVSPQSGYSITQVFTLSVLNCQDQDLPLTYQFFYYNSQEEYQQEILQPWNIHRRQILEQSDSNLLQTILPSGNLVLMAQVLDSKLAVFNTTISIKVVQFSANPQAIQSIFNQNLQQKDQFLPGQQMITFNIIAEELIKISSKQQSQAIFELSQNILAQQLQLQQLLPITSLVQTFTNKVFAQLSQSTTTYQSSSIVQDLSFNQINQNLKNLNMQANKINQLQQDNSLVMQLLVDSFKILNSTSLYQSLSYNNQLEKINLSNQIGQIMINNTFIENQGSIYLEGKDQSILVDKITDKNLNKYIISSLEQNTNQTQTYSVLYNILSQNIYYNQSEFQEYVKKLKQQIPNIDVSNNKVISLQIKSMSNQNVLKDPMFFYQFNDFNVNSNLNMTCIQKLNNSWQYDQCQSMKIGNNYSCVCQNQQPTTLVESLTDILLKNQSVNSVSNSQVSNNFQSLTQPYKFISFWILTSTTLINIVFWYFGIKLDNKFLQNKLLSNKHQNKLIIQKPVINQVEKEKKDNEILVSELDDSPYYPDEIANNKIKINRLQNLKTNQIQKENKESQIQVSELDYSPYYPNEIANSKIIINRLQSLKTRSILIQEKTPSINKKIDKTENLTEIQITRGDSNPFGNQVTNKDIQQQVTDSLQTYPSFEKGSTTNKKQNQIKSGENKSSNQQINKDLIVFDNKESKSNQKVESIIENIIKKADSIISATNKIESKIQEDQYNTLNTEQSDENNIELNQKNKIQLQNEAVEKNSKNKEENIIKKQETYKLVQQLSFLIRIFIFHNFFSIFLIYNQDLSRPYRFLQIYLNVIHTLALSILFYDCRFFYQYFLNSLLNVIIIESVLFFLEYLYKKKGFLQMISITLKIIILSVYYYIIAYNILDQNPTEANLFVELFLIATGTNFVVLQCVGILLKNLIIALYFKWTESNTFICWIYRILHLQDIFDCI
ncbi:hypothetical protein ABPG74_007824 [Tetrahymena malaccensis]